MNVNANAAAQTLASPAFIKSAVLVVSGSLAATIVTQLGRSHIYDVSFRGGDAAYAVGAAFLLMILPLPSMYTRPAALGAGAGAVHVLANEFGVLDKAGLSNGGA